MAKKKQTKKKSSLGKEVLQEKKVPVYPKATRRPSKCTGDCEECNNPPVCNNFLNDLEKTTQRLSNPS